MHCKLRLIASMSKPARRHSNNVSDPDGSISTVDVMARQQRKMNGSMNTAMTVENHANGLHMTTSTVPFRSVIRNNDGRRRNYGHRFLSTAIRDSGHETAEIVDADAASVSVQFRDNDGRPRRSTFHASWLWMNDPKQIHPTSGQRMRSLAEYSQKASKIKHAAIRAASEFNDGDDHDDNVNDGDPLHIKPPIGSFHSAGGVYQTILNDSHHVRSTKSCAQRMILVVDWEDHRQRRQGRSYYDLDWLQEWCHDDEVRLAKKESNRVTADKAIGAASADTKKIQEWNYDQLMQSDGDRFNEETLMNMLDAIFHDGAVLVHGMPSYECSSGQEAPMVAKLGRALTTGGMLSHGALYGDVFHVKATPNASNIAFTNHELPPHQDLAYYESKPFLQLLHCVENNNVVGGASTLIDAMAAAQEFAKLRPAHFELLCTYQASFIKQRDGAQMARYIPHIQTAPKTMMPTQDDANGRIGNSWVQDVEVVAVHWSPPFEGPLVHVPPQMMASFQDAYKAFSLMLDSSMHDDREEKPDFGDDIDDDIDDAHRRLDEDELRQYAKKYTWEYTLCKGDVLLFNNQRMLHGRRRFELLEGNNHLDAPGCRHLIGCYTNVDETSSGWSMLRRAFGVTEDSLHPNVGNGSSAR